MTSIVYAFAILCTKLTILLLYRRVFLPHRWGRFDVTLRLFMAICCLFYLSTVPVKIWECIPRARIWDRSIEGTCISIPKLLNTVGLVNTLTDFFILVIPINALWKLQMKARKKVGIALLITLVQCMFFNKLIA